MADILPITGVNIAYLTAIAVAVVVGIIIYKFFLQPTGQFALPDEEDEGTWKISMPTLGRFNEGRVNPAHTFCMKNWAKEITSEPDPNKKKDLIASRDFMMKFYIYAQRCGRSKILYFFDQDPLSPQYHAREPSKSELIKWIGPVQDAESKNAWKGFEPIIVKLNTTNVPFTPEERERNGAMLRIAAYQEQAAMNIEALRHTRDERDTYKDLHTEDLTTLAEERSEKNIAEKGLARVSLNAASPVAQKGGFMANVGKNWFTGFQMFIAALAFIVTPSIVKYLGYTILDPTSLGIAGAIVVFIGYPFIRGMMKRD